KYRYLVLFGLISGLALTTSCNNSDNNTVKEDKEEKKDGEGEFQYIADQFADLQILRYQVPGFDELSAQQKELLYYLYEAALCGRDIIYDQKYEHNLAIRKTLENMVQTYSGDKNSKNWEKLMTYVKRVWFSNGIHHHYSNIKFLPEVS